ncbi:MULTISPECIES: monooxygenase [Sorangium]|uniref:Copper type II ascorbate-dependent monooxygenase C-terminal domain-containing protein n=1 Tax=Sorangium atrum TaxID=2995308 RepID=A0ABT5BXM6_9BACT|nr:hypothetical protein [Sorangium aterium]MDC0678881.1 hypothetical protein [Sorangium aterium]
MRTTTSLIALLGATALFGCSSSSPTPQPSEDEILAPPAEGTGVQYRMVSTLQPAQEIERCQLFVAPPEGLNVNREVVRFSGGSHHVLLYTTPYTSIPTETRRGVALDATQVHDCNDGPQADWEVNGVVAGSQSPDGNSFLGDLPDGVALKVPPGTVLLMNTHYLNSSSNPIETDARINLYTIADDEVEVEAGMLFHYNPFISVPAHGSSTARMRCVTENDISVVRIQSHMHRRGVGYAANKVALDGTMTELYAHDRWEGVPSKEFSPFLEVKAGESLDYHCDFNNVEDRNIAQGLTTRDEMCMLIGPYFPRSPAYENCRTEEGLEAATWFGDGQTTCAQAFECLGSAQDDAAAYGCVVNSCESVGPQLSAALACQMTGGNGACIEACDGQDAEACNTCIGTACGAEMEACQAATCD